MEYSINELGKLAGISTRTLRYYDEVGLLTPLRISSSGYRIYGPKEVNLLQQILFYRELEFPLIEIKKIVLAKDFDVWLALQNHLTSLLSRKEELEQLIITVNKTIANMKGEVAMSDKEKFMGFKEKMIQTNEEKYGKEIREKYGNDNIDASNKKLKNMTQEQYSELEKLTLKLNETLKIAFLKGNPASELAQQVCTMHKDWLSYYWNFYSKDAHIGLAQMYVDDPRFKKYYDDISFGCAEFLRDALLLYCK